MFELQKAIWKEDLFFNINQLWKITQPLHDDLHTVLDDALVKQRLKQKLYILKEVVSTNMMYLIKPG